MSDSLRPHGLQPSRLLCPWEFSRQEYWNGLPFFFSRESSQPRDWTCIPWKSPALQVDSYHWATQLLFFFLVVKNEFTKKKRMNLHSVPKRHSHSNHLPSFDNFYSFQKSGLSYPGSLFWFTIIQDWCLFSARKFSSNKYSTNKKQSHVIFHTPKHIYFTLHVC